MKKNNPNITKVFTEETDGDAVEIPNIQNDENDKFENNADNVGNGLYDNYFHQYLFH